MSSFGGQGVDMFGNGSQDEPAQTDGQQPVTGAPAQSEPVIGQPFNMTGGQTPDLSTAPSEPTSAPVPQDAAITPEGDGGITAETSTAADSISSDESTDVSLPPVEASTPTPPDDHGNIDDLTAIKQQALQDLSPLVGHLEQTPEEKFRTTMMMIQAADDQTLIKTAYDAAGQIQDEKVRAQALLDVINEINYFTQQKKES